VHIVPPAVTLQSLVANSIKFHCRIMNSSNDSEVSIGGEEGTLYRAENSSTIDSEFPNVEDNDWGEE